MYETVIVHGYSDDLVEIEGAHREELTLPVSDKGRLELSDGTEIKVKYDGEWHFDVVNNPGHNKYNVLGVGVVDVYNDYSEVVVLESEHGVDSATLEEY